MNMSSQMLGGQENKLILVNTLKSVEHVVVLITYIFISLHE